VPKTDDQRHGDVLGRILSYLVAITTILGIPVALYGYFVSQQTSRVDRTFDYYKDFRSGSLQNDVNLLVESWNAKGDEVNKLLAQNDYTGLAQLVKTLAENGQTAGALSRVVVFYDGIGSCIEHALCDAHAAVALLKDSTEQIVPTYGSYLQTIQRTNPPFAVGIFTVYGLKPKWWWSLIGY
jgi:hypothetical protein